MEENIGALAIPGTHERFLKFLSPLVSVDTSPKVLDIGAGQGALSKRLHEAGFSVDACELDPAVFRYSEVECRQADLTQSLPYENSTFDTAVAVEVMEHLVNPDVLFAECARVLKDDGIFAMSTPNILSLKSRIRFLVCGFFYSFKPVKNNDDGLAHVSSLTVDQYRYIASRHGFEMISLETDVRQNSSMLLLWLWPVLNVLSRFQKVDHRIHNQFKMLVGRKLFIAFRRR